MFLPVTKDRNRPLIEAALALHASGALPPDVYVIDLDAVDHNAAAIAAEAALHGLTPWFVVKQIGRNPLVTDVVRRHIPRAAAIDEREAERVVAGHGALGNVGHLVQIPLRDLPGVIDLRPSVITVFDEENLRAVAGAAAAQGIVQDVLLRIAGAPGDVYPGQEGGFDVDAVARVHAESRDIAGARIAGVTGFPCVLYSDADRLPRPTATLDRVLAAADVLRGLGLADVIVDLPSLSSVATLAELARLGATHAEPGHALTGTTPHHAVDHTLTEIPAMVYLTEVAHQDADGPMVFGGGFYRRGHARHAVVRGAGGDTTATVRDAPAEHIDYYRRIDPESPVQVGDGVVLAFRTQIFVTRSFVAIVSGLATDHPVLEGVHDAGGRPVPLDELRPGARTLRLPPGWTLAASAGPSS